MSWLKVGREHLVLPTLARSISRAATIRVPVANGARLLRLGSDRAVVIPDGGVMIGRDRDSDLVVSGPHVSRRHGVVRRSIRGYILTDVSRNGTYVNGRRVRGARVLRAGDVVRIGDEELRLEVSCVTHDDGVTLPGLLLRQLANLKSAVRPIDFGRRFATSWRLRTASVLSGLTKLGRPALSARLRAFWTI